MKLVEALKILAPSVSAESPLLDIHLACGFTPLHLLTFLNAHLRLEFPDHRIQIQTGIFGDLAGNLERLESTPADAVVVVIEPPDLDPRLGVRSLGGWRPKRLADITRHARDQAMRL